MDKGVQFASAPIRHRRAIVDGIDTLYREAGPADAPIVLLPHGYPASSFVYRNLMAAQSDRYRLIAPELPGFGYSATPSAQDFGYTFDAYAAFLKAFVDALDLDRYVIWLHDYGSQFGFRLALSAPDRVAGLIIQNGDIYEDAFGPKYDFLKESWQNPGPASRRTIAEHITLKGFESEFRGELPDDVADRPPTLIVWGPARRLHAREVGPGIPPRPARRPDPLLGGGHWLLETHLDEVLPLVGGFLEMV